MLSIVLTRRTPDLFFSFGSFDLLSWLAVVDVDVVAVDAVVVDAVLTAARGLAGPVLAVSRGEVGGRSAGGGGPGGICIFGGCGTSEGGGGEGAYGSGGICTTGSVGFNDWAVEVATLFGGGGNGRSWFVRGEGAFCSAMSSANGFGGIVHPPGGDGSAGRASFALPPRVAVSQGIGCPAMFDGVDKVSAGGTWRPDALDGENLFWRGNAFESLMDFLLMKCS